MAQIDPSSGDGKKKKGAQKKMSIHVDFTPMVDMNMLLITFFMLCTTMIKSQTLQILLPSNDQRIKDEQKNQAKADDAISLILDTEYKSNGLPAVDENGNTLHDIYYYEGLPDTVNISGTKGCIKVAHFKSRGDAHNGNIGHFIHRAAAYDLHTQKLSGSLVCNKLCNK